MGIRTGKIIADLSGIPYIIYSAIFQKINLKNQKELVSVNYEIIPDRKIKEIFRQIHNRSEDFLFWMIQKTPERFIPSSLMVWIDNYLDRRIMDLKHETTRQNWNKTYLDHALKEIQYRQQDKEKAPSEE